ncbi:MAG: hypothetical protein N2654_01095 [Deltaproteobacteria bacterium]|nr:hypothetical protein [Deltaproteobacteria bacterium]
MAQVLFGGPQALFDTYPPEIVPKRLAKFVGSSPQNFEFLLQDLSSLAKIRYQLFFNKQKVLDKTIKSEREKSKTLSITIDPSKAQFKQGKYKLVITATDGSVRANRTAKEYEFIIDFTKPHILPISYMHNVRRGGLELFFYELLNDASSVECVIVNQRIFFPGIPAELFGIKTRRKVKGTFFSIPFSDIKSLALMSYANNFDTHFFKFPHLILDFKGRETVLTPAIASKIRQISRKLTQSSSKFKLEDCELPRMPQSCEAVGEFEKPISRGSYYAAYGQNILSEDKEKLKLSFDVFWLTDVNSEIISPQSGYLEDFSDGVLVINYGCGLRSHLYPVELQQKQIGETVKKGERVGMISRTLSDFVGHQISIWGHPINNRELEDKSWVNDHILKKIALVKDISGTR